MPHIHKEQVLHDIQHWNEEKERLYKFRISEKERLAELGRVRAAEAAEQEAKRQAALKAAEEERLRKIQEELGSQTGEDPPESPNADTKIEIPDGEGDGKEEGSGSPKAAEEGGDEAAKQAYYEKQME